MGATKPLETRLLARISKTADMLPRVTSNELSDVADQLRSQGKDIITLCGSPYWEPPEYVYQAAERAAGENANAPSKGFLELRQAIAGRLEGDGINVDPHSQIVVTNGAMHAVSLIFATFLDPGDEVALYRPSFFFFGPIRLAGGVPIYAETREENNWRWDAKALEKAISPRTRMIVLNSPTNPTGYTAMKDDFLAVAEIARKHDLLIVSDESYDNMIYEGSHIRIASLPEARDRTITVCSFTKSFVMQPWRLGFIAASPEVIVPLQKVLEWNVLRCSHVAQRAGEAALSGPQEWRSEIARKFQHCRDLMVEQLHAAVGLRFAIPAAGPFLFLNVTGLGLSGTDFSVRLLNEYGVVTDPGAFFQSDSHVRLPFGGSDVVVVEAAKRIVDASRKFIEEHAGMTGQNASWTTSR